MNNLNKLANLDPSSIREFIKSNQDNESFLNEVLDNKEEYLTLLTKNSALTSYLTEKLSQTPKDAQILVNECIKNNFVPSLVLVESLINQQLDQLLKLTLESFPSIPINVSLFMQIINNEMIDSAEYLMKLKKEFQKEEIFTLLYSKIHIEDEELLKIAIEYPLFASLVLEDFSENSYPSWVITKILKDHKKLIKDSHIPNMIGYSSDESTVEELLKMITVQDYYSSNRKVVIQVLYHRCFEKIEEIGLFSRKNIVPINTPFDSKFRKYSISKIPSEATNEELIDLFNLETLNSDNVELEMVKRGKSFLEKVDLQFGFQQLSPARLRDLASSDKELAKYLYEVLPAKYHSQLAKVVPPSEISKKETKKSSYFSEMMQAMESVDIDSFRLYAQKYPVSRFSIDSHQSSKARSCELFSVKSEMVLLFDKEELLTLVESKIRFSEPDTKLSYSLTPEESIAMVEKFGIDFAYKNCNHKLNLILNKKVGEEDLSTLFEYNKEEITKNEDLLTALFSRMKNNSINIRGDGIKLLAPFLKAKDLRKMADVDTYEYCDIVDLKCKDGEYFVDNEMFIKCVNSHMESRSFIDAVIRKDEEYSKLLIEAYFKGNKGLSKLLNAEIKIRRGKKTDFEMYLKNLKTDTTAMAEQIFNNGAKLEEFKSNLMNWEEIVKKEAKGRAVVVNESSVSDAKDLIESGILIKINTLDLNYGSMEDLKFVMDNSEVSSLYMRRWDKEDYEISSLISLLKSSNVSLKLDSSDADLGYELLKNNIEFIGKDEFIISEIESLSSMKSLSNLKLLENHGLMYTTENVQSLIETQNREIIYYIKSRVGSLSKYVVVEDYSLDEEGKEMLKEFGVTIKSEDEHLYEQIMQEVKESVNGVYIGNLNSANKIKVIKYIEDNVDANYKKLNLRSTNIEDLDRLESYENMRAIYSQEDEDVVRVFGLTNNFSSNKKLMKGLKDLMSITGGQVVSQIINLKKAVKSINPQMELELSDVVDYKDLNNIVQSPYLNQLDYENLEMVGENQNSILLKNRTKNQALKFLMSISNQNNHYVRDIFQIAERIQVGLFGLEDELKVSTGEERERLLESIASLKSKFQEILEIDDSQEMHDKLVNLARFIKSNPNQSLRQDLFKDLESKPTKIGYSLYFPKTRGDLIFLGDENGWCVNSHVSYGDGVISSGNILVAICEGESTRENAIALAHYIKEGKDSYYLEQLKWSSRKKDGKKNIDAEKDFNHSEILSLLVSHLKKHGKESK